MTIQRWFGGHITGLAADTKPLTEPTGTTFLETNTRKQFVFDAAVSEWLPQEFPTYKNYKVIKVGATTYILDIYGRRVSSNTDTQVAVQALIEQIPNNAVWTLKWDAEQWTMNNPIILPTFSAQGITKKIVMEGTGYSFTQASAGVTRLLASATFPTNRYFFELNNPSLLAINGHVHITKFAANLGAAGEGKNIGFLKLEGGNMHPGRRGVEVDHCYLEYMWRAIHLKGMIWYGYFHDIVTLESSATFSGDAVWLIEDSGIVDPAQNPSPKANNFQRIYHTGGGGGTSPQYQDWLRITTGSYNMIRDVFVDGKTFGHAVIALNGALGVSKNRFQNITTLDLEYPTPNTTVANLHLSGTNVYNNKFSDMHLTPNPVTVLMEGSGVKKNDIEIDAHWGARSIVTDTTADPSNVLRPGSTSDPTLADTTIIHNGATSRVVDPRRGAEKAGFTSVADGGTIAHGLFTTPLWVQLTPSLANTIAGVTAKSATTFTVSLKTDAGAPGTTQSVYWRAGVYA